jgi:hypothetical protein
LLLRCIPASSLIPRATETSQCYEHLHLARRTRIGTTHACVLISLVLLSACPLSIAGSITAGWGHTCALTAFGGVRCWGLNNQGQASVVHAFGALLPVHIEFWSCLLCAAWRWYNHGSKHAISRCADKCGCNRCWMVSHMCNHNLGWCEMLGCEWIWRGKCCACIRSVAASAY